MSEFLQGDLRKYVFNVQDFKGKRYINMRLYERFNPLDEKAWNPIHKGLFIPIEFAGELRKAIDRLMAELEFNPKEERTRKA
jgi:hypothetical protein